MFWENYVRLCQSRGISPNAVAKMAGAKSTGTVSAWKKGAVPRDGVLTSIADFFGVTKEELLGDSVGEPQSSDIMAAFFGGYADDLTDEERDGLWRDAQDFARFRADQMRKEKKRKDGKG